MVVWILDNLSAIQMLPATVKSANRMFDNRIPTILLKCFMTFCSVSCSCSALQISVNFLVLCCMVLQICQPIWSYAVGKRVCNHLFSGCDEVLQEGPEPTIWQLVGIDVTLRCQEHAPEAKADRWNMLNGHSLCKTNNRVGIWIPTIWIPNFFNSDFTNSPSCFARKGTIGES